MDGAAYQAMRAAVEAERRAHFWRRLRLRLVIRYHVRTRMRPLALRWCWRPDWFPTWAWRRLPFALKHRISRCKGVSP